MQIREFITKIDDIILERFDLNIENVKVEIVNGGYADVAGVFKFNIPHIIIGDYVIVFKEE